MGLPWKLACAWVVLAGVGCGPKCPEPEYDGKASDEAYRTMRDAEARATPDSNKAPRFEWTDGMQLPRSAPPTLRWSSSLSASAPALPRPGAPRRSTPWYRGLLLSQAHAHLPPVTGPVYWLQFAVPGESCPVEVLTTRTDWTPSSQAWSRLALGNGSRTLTAHAAYLVENRISEGPFRTPGAVRFTVAP